MRITFENDKKLTLIYIYVREFDGVIVNTIPDIQADLIFDKNDYWLGVEVFNDILEDYKIKLPNLKRQYISINNEIFMQSKESLYILFEADKSEGYRKRVSCNIDYNNVNGLQGIELILSCVDIKTKLLKSLWLDIVSLGLNSRLYDINVILFYGEEYYETIRERLFRT